MSLQVEKLGKSMAKLTIEVSAETFDKALETAFQKNKHKISVPGFRKGKAPRKMVEKVYGKGMFYEDAANELVAKEYEKALEEECAEEVVSYPKFGVEQMEAGKPFIFTAEVALKPPVALGKYKGVEVAKADTQVSDGEVDAKIEQERESNARSVPVEGRPVRDGDTVLLDYEGFLDGTAFPGGKGEDQSLTIGSGDFLPGFEEGLVGARIGEKKAVSVTFPDNYQEPSLAGKEAVFECVVKELREKLLSPLDDEFASEVSEFDTLEDYRADIRRKLSEEKARQALADKEEAVLDAIVAQAQMEIPSAMEETKKEQMLEDFSTKLRRSGIDIEKYMQYTGLTQEALESQIGSRALQSIQRRLVLEAVAEAEHLEAGEEEFQAEAAKLAEADGKGTEEILEALGQEGREQLRKDLRVNKALRWVLENAVEI
ncbi:MAG: trigger factor [Clostridium sp.]|nr:trigger factor [Clostridium sp.]